MFDQDFQGLIGGVTGVKGYPVILGEYGCQWRNLSSQSNESQAKHDASVRLFYKLVNQYAVNNGIVPVV